MFQVKIVHLRLNLFPFIWTSMFCCNDLLSKVKYYHNCFCLCQQNTKMCLSDGKTFGQVTLERTSHGLRLATDTPLLCGVHQPNSLCSSMHTEVVVTPHEEQ